MSRCRVYVPNNMAHTATDAEKFGELVYITEGPVNRLDVAGHASRIAESLLESEPNDWLVIGSLSILSSLCAAQFAHLHGRLNLLVWANGRYVPKRVPMG